MEQKIQLIHPAGKKAVKMDKIKYEAIKKVLLHHLTIKGELSHSEILQSVQYDFLKNDINFEGSVAWHTEWVKLDLEARNKIKRIRSKSISKYAIA